MNRNWLKSKIERLDEIGQMNKNSKFESNLSPELSQVANLSKLSTNRVVHFQHELASEKSESGAEDTVHVGNTSDSKLSEVAKIEKAQSLARIIPIIEPMSWEAVAEYKHCGVLTKYARDGNV